MVIILDEGPNLRLLDRRESLRLVQQQYGHHLSLLEELVNYCTYLLPRSLNSSSGEIKDIVVCGIFHHSISISDSIHEQVKAGAIRSAAILLRSLAEAAWAIEYILSEESDYRARCYYVEKLRREIKTIRGILPNTHEHAVMKQVSIREEWDPSLDDDQTLYQRERLHELRTHLRRKVFHDINRDFRRKVMKAEKQDRLPIEPHWTAIAGVGGVAGLARELNRADEYEVIYCGYSAKVHGTDLDDHIEIREETAVMSDIRFMRELPQVLRLTETYISRIMGMITETYRAEEMALLEKKYDTKWRARYLTIPPIRIEPIRSRLAQ